MIQQDNNSIKRNLVISLITSLQTSSRQNFLILMNGQNFLNFPGQNILCLPQSITMDFACGQIKLPTEHGGLTGMQVMLAHTAIYWEIFLKLLEKHQYTRVCIIHCMNGLILYGNLI